MTAEESPAATWPAARTVVRNVTESDAGAGGSLHSRWYADAAMAPRRAVAAAAVATASERHAVRCRNEFFDASCVRQPGKRLAGVWIVLAGNRRL
jgi:hypothetical protein